MPRLESPNIDYDDDSSSNDPVRIEMTKSQVDKGGKYFKLRKENQGAQRATPKSSEPQILYKNVQ